MPNIYETDWQLSSSIIMIEAIDLAIQKLREGAGEWSQVTEEILDHEEYLFGVAFVIAQSYITGVISDAINMVGDRRVKKGELLKASSIALAGTTTTQIELCDSMANYFKHHDEWPEWRVPGRHQGTVAILQSIGIDSVDLLPCHKAMNVLWPDRIDGLSQHFPSMLSDWRKGVIRSYIVSKESS